MGENVLRLENVTMQFGGVVAVNDLSMEINKGEIVALIGPNGAGKTTAFNVITGVYAPTNGQVSFNGKVIVRNHPQGKMKKLYKGSDPDKYTGHVLEPTPDRITGWGMARTFQNIRLWPSQTVFDNVLIAKHLRRTSNLLTAAFRLNRAEEQRQREEVLELLRTNGANFTALASIREQYVEQFSNELCWSYPFCDGDYLGCVVLPVQEGILCLPYSSLDGDTYEQFVLESAGLLTREQLDELKRHLLTQAAELYNALSDMSRFLPDVSTRAGEEL